MLHYRESPGLSAYQSALLSLPLKGEERREGGRVVGFMTAHHREKSRREQGKELLFPDLEK